MKRMRILAGKGADGYRDIEETSIGMLVETLKEVEGGLEKLSNEVAHLRDMYEIPLIAYQLKEFLDQGALDRITTELIQKRFKVGYARASRIKDFMEAKGFIAEE